MAKLPNPVLDYLHAVVMANRPLAFFLVEPEGTVADWGGDLAFYGMPDPRRGQPIGELVLSLDGVFPPADEPRAPTLILPVVEVWTNRFADIHLFPETGRYWVLLLDRSEEAELQQRYQQRGNELSLLYERNTRILAQYLGEEIAESLARGLLTVREGGERREITILFVDIRRFTPFSERNGVELVFETLNIYLQVMIEPILDEKGLVDKIMGDAVMALFGVIPAEQRPPKHAVTAAVQMIERVKSMNERRTRESKPTLEIGAGIATGQVALGILGTKERRTFSAIGHHVNLAARLEATAMPMEILIDGATFDKIGSLNRTFTRKQAVLKGIGEPVTIFSRQVK